MRIMCHTPSTWKVGLNEMAKRGWDNTVLSSTNPVQRSAGEVNRSDADMQVVSCHSYLVIFHLVFEQLTMFYISGLVL